ncbi:MAG: hypothetical protein NWT08_08745 [Akkermansiaceae bacterium]|jgi:hypothetical protein|nr:hypothetical protein [Akkermansiaceae bacterium]MDP4648031.1 hypothetical protein [Akkermansiaceae bacterium]MDP4720316.1 hypothetical protein [Akkermansiaceae bacterium]MDP4781379.1 hypothetical protein [Akkermansiaceae bacterium]MDP4848698.1 hypothetical protein [Akkermansiaceae bacterium]
MLSYEVAFGMIEEIKGSSQTDLREDLLRSAIRYASVRAEFALMSADERREADVSRTRLHNVFIADCDILARAMNKAGEVCGWRERLGQERKRIGDLACWMVLIFGLGTR